MIIKPAVKRLRFARDASGNLIVVSDCGKSWPVPEGRGPIWFMSDVTEELIEDGYTVIMDQDVGRADQ